MSSPPGIPPAEVADGPEDGAAAAIHDAPSEPSEPRPIPADAEAGSVHSVHAMSGFSVGLSVDTESSDADSSLGDISRPSSSVSVSSSVYEFVEDFGRTFHKYKEGKYVMPNDELEQNRLDLQHAIMNKVLGGRLSTAPIDKPHRVLDLGTGTGIWAVEFAEKNPSSSVIGIDLSPIQPEYVPPNCSFEIDDCEDEWVWGHRFDYIHGRYLVPFLADVPRLLKSIYDNLTPGGFVEFQEAAFIFQAIDDSLEGTPLQEWDDKILEGMRRTGREPLIALRLKALMVEAGFVNIHETRRALPINPWPKGKDQKLIGAMEMHNFLEVCHGISMNILCKVFGWSTERVELLLVQVRENIKDRNIHAYFPFVCIWGQRPE